VIPVIFTTTVPSAALQIHGGVNWPLGPLATVVCFDEDVAST
jgi:hypothetical protein